MKKYKVVIMPQAEADLDDIYSYIANTLREPGIAAKQKQRIADGIRGLNQMPGRFPLYGAEPWRSQGLRYLTVNNYLTVYKILEESNAVAVLTVVYAKRDIERILQDESSL